MPAKISLDRFELLWYMQGFMGGSHLRWSGYERMVNDVWQQLTDKERECIYMYAKRDLSWHFEGDHVDETPHKYFQQVLARYNPANQYSVTVDSGAGAKIVSSAYLWQGKYYTAWNRYCAPEYIKKVERKPYRKCVNDYCASRTDCLRFIEHNKGDEILDGGQFGCDKCDFIIEKEDEQEG